MQRLLPLPGALKQAIGTTNVDPNLHWFDWGFC